MVLPFGKMGNDCAFRFDDRDGICIFAAGWFSGVILFALIMAAAVFFA